MKIRTSIGFIIALSVLFNIIFIAYIFFSSGKKQAPINEITPQFPFLSKRIFLENQNDLLINFIDLRTQLNNYINGVPNKIGIYFEYLPSGTSIGINDKQNFLFASLLKIPVIMAVYSQIEQGAITPDTTYTITDQYIDSSYGTFWKKGVGTKASVQELIRLSLVESDNTASNMLYGHLPEGAVEKIFDSLDIPKHLEKNAPVVTPKNYASILRSLYLSAILSKEHSNEILSLLTESIYLFPSTAPYKSIPVAHKIGIYGVGSETNWVYSDCGIYYPPKRPYILCIMTETDAKTAETILTNIPSFVYSYVTKQPSQ